MPIPTRGRKRDVTEFGTAVGHSAKNVVFEIRRCAKRSSRMTTEDKRSIQRVSCG